MTLFQDEPYLEPEADKYLKRQKQRLAVLRVKWWIEDHPVQLFIIAFIVIVFMTCGGC